VWFEKLTGFQEESPEQVYKNISIDGKLLKSHINGKEYAYGLLETPNLAELRKRANYSTNLTKKTSICELVADVQQLHNEESNTDSLFQVASQFNLLEMVSPEVTPEEGVEGYEDDFTQGPACAIAAGAGTIYRNYFVDVNGKLGQTYNNQIDCLADIGIKLGNSNNSLWEMKNGYALVSKEGLITINNKIISSSKSEVDELRKMLRIGIQWGTEITLNDCKHTVSQVYCSALPIGYLQYPLELWDSFAKVILEALYEATICVGILNFRKTGNNKVYLTLVGGGVFGNKTEWIIDAIKRSLNLYSHTGLDIIIVSHKYSNLHVKELIDEIRS
jgi:hypothetical protein